MKTDMTTKLLLGAIALGVWVNALGVFSNSAASTNLDPWLIRLAPMISSIEANLDRLVKSSERETAIRPQ